MKVVVCQIGDYHAINGKMATVIFDDKKIAECYTNEDAMLVGAALRAWVDEQPQVVASSENETVFDLLTSDNWQITVPDDYVITGFADNTISIEKLVKEPK